MNKNHFLVICLKNAGKEWAYVMTVRGTENLVNLLDDSRILTANICDSKKEAERIADMWNAQFKKAGIFPC